MREINKRKIERDVADIVMLLVSDDRKKDISKWLRNFRSRNVWDLQSDEENIALILDSIVIAEDGSSVMHWIDGSIQNYQFSAFQPAKHKAERHLSLDKPNQEPVKESPAVRTGVCENCRTLIDQKPKTKKRRFLLR